MTDAEREGTFAEVFDALGHPTRLRVMKILREQALNFADLKRALNIESSGHLQYHLGKLRNLVKTDQQGKYTLSDDGKDALLMVENVEKMSGTERKIRLTPRMSVIVRAISTVAIVLLLVLGITAFLGNMYYEQTVYRYELMVGDLYNPSASLGHTGFVDLGPTLPFSLEPNQTLGFANVVIPPSNYTTGWYEQDEIDYQTRILLQESNQTFKTFPYAVFKLTLSDRNPFSLNATHMFVRVNVSTGPNGSVWPEVIFYYSGAFPPYETSTTETPSYGYLPGGAFWTYRILPITGYGKYTYSLTNIGNITATGNVSFWSTEITVNARYLDTKLNTTISDPVRIYPETRIYAKPLTTESRIFIASIVFFSAASIYLINKGNRVAFRRSSYSLH